MREDEYRGFSPGSFRDFRASRFLLLALLGFIAGATLINVLVTRPFWRPYLGSQTKKLERIAELAPQIDVMFLGPSHIDNGVDPRTFDAVAAACGEPTFSFNGAVPDIRGPEIRHYLDEWKQVPGLRPKVVFVEPLINPSPPLGRFFTTRVRYHFSLDAVAEGVRARLAGAVPWTRKLASTSIQLAAATIHQANLGVLAELALPACPACIAAKLETGPVDQRPSRRYDRGYAGEVSDPGVLSSDNYEAWLRANQGRRRVDEAGLRATPRTLDEGEVAYLRRLFGQIRALGAEPVALFPPLSIDLLDHRSIRAGIRQHFPEIAVFSYLYDDALAAGGPLLELFNSGPAWRDDTHMTPEGAKAFASIVAADYCRQRRDSATSSARHALH